jgi:DNA polymerase I-like protein with 3'-5' exonuclease and polymerase domains|tara:strand:+ start:411 stop:608 length:198 start_codon:yes stop_codon:yes gene_type:complete
VGAVLFEVLGLGSSAPHLRLARKAKPCGRKRACEWQTSTAALGLIAAEHPLPSMIIEHRQLTFMP